MTTSGRRASWRRKAAAVAAAAFVCGVAWCVARACLRAALRRDLAAKGFPPSYVRLLLPLAWEHPRWRFEPLPVTDLSWDAIVGRECTPSWNLVAASGWAPGRWRALGAANYTPYWAENAPAYDSGAWRQASRAAIAYFMDPRNFFNARDVFQFETLGFDAASHTRAAVEQTLAGTCLADARPDGGARTYAELLLDVGRRLNLSPVFLAGRLASEQGAGTAQARGTIGDALAAYATNETGRVGDAVVWGRRFTRTGAATSNVLARGRAAYNGYYNFFNFRAYGLGLFEIKYNAWAEAADDETRAKYGGPWTNQTLAVAGGAAKVRALYVDTRRHTRYLQKFSVLAEAGAFRWKQYMQNIAAPLVEARASARGYEAAGARDAPYLFLVPVFRGMPDEPCPDPAAGRSVYSPSR